MGMIKKMKRLTVFGLGAATGAAAVYYFDPRYGTERRAQAAEQLLPAAQRFGETALEKGKELSETVIEKSKEIIEQRRSDADETLDDYRDAIVGDSGLGDATDGLAAAIGSGDGARERETTAADATLPPPLAADLIGGPDPDLGTTDDDRLSTGRNDTT